MLFCRRNQPFLGSGPVGRSEESNSGSELEQKEPTDSGLPIANLCFSSFLSYQVGDKLRQLETSWVGLVSKNYEIEQVR